MCFWLGGMLWALQGAGEELGLDISQVDALTLRQLQHYVQSCFSAGEGAVSWPDCLVGSGESFTKHADLDAALCVDHCHWPARRAMAWRSLTGRNDPKTPTNGLGRPRMTVQSCMQAASLTLCRLSHAAVLPTL